jgi:hypothetical protein
MLRRVVWWLDTNVSEDRAVSIFRVEMRGDGKVDIDTGRVWGYRKDMGKGLWKGPREEKCKGVLGRVGRKGPERALKGR